MSSPLKVEVSEPEVNINQWFCGTIFKEGG